MVNGHLVSAMLTKRSRVMGEGCNLVPPLQTSSLDSAHDQNVPQRPSLGTPFGVEL
jgi:hypothetical protein